LKKLGKKLSERFLRSFVHSSEHMFKKMNFITSRSLEILYYLLSNPMEQFHGRQIARQTSVSVGAVNQFLRKFYKIDLVEMSRRGKTNLYRANLKNPIARQFKVLFNVLTLNELIDKIKDDSDRIVLFGSCAEGTDVKYSDIDLFVLTSDIKTIQREVRLYERKIDRRIAPIIINPNELAKMKTKDKPLHERISKGITLWERE